MATGFPVKANYATGDVLSATNMNDLSNSVNLLAPSATTGQVGYSTGTNTALSYQPAFLAGKNKIINGDFGVWQRGTSFSLLANSLTYTADRWASNRDGTGATVTASQQTFTPGTAPVAGYESAYFWQFAQTVAGSGGTYNQCLFQRIEDVRTFAGQTITISFWAKADTTRNLIVGYNQNFGSGGSGSINASTTISVTSSWTRYTLNYNLTALSSKTIGTGSNLELYFQIPINTIQTWSFWGVQLEAGSTATSFTTATGTIQGELAACQRYFQRFANGADNTSEFISMGQATSTSATVQTIRMPVVMRGNPVLTISSGSHFSVTTSTYSLSATTGVAADQYSPRTVSFSTSGSTGLTAGNASGLRANSASATLDLSAEL